MILSTVTGISYIPKQYIQPHLSVAFLLAILVTLVLTAGPTCIAIVEYSAGRVPRSHSRYCLISTLLFGIMSSDRMFCNRVARKSRKYLRVSRLKLSRPVIRFYILKRAWGRLFMVSCIRLQVYGIVPFPNPYVSRIQSRPWLE